MEKITISVLETGRSRFFKAYTDIISQISAYQYVKSVRSVKLVHFWL